MHIGSEHFVVQGWQPSSVQACFGQMTEQWGFPQFILHAEMSGPAQRVWQVGLSHTGWQSSSHLGLEHL